MQLLREKHRMAKWEKNKLGFSLGGVMLLGTLALSLLVATPAPASAFAPSPSIWRQHGVDTVSVDDFTRHLTASMAMCTATNSIKLMETETRIIRGEQVDAASAVRATVACQDTAIAKGDSLFRRLRAQTKQERRLDAIKDTYAYWRASMLDLAPRLGESTNTQYGLYERRIRPLQEELRRRVERLKLEYL